MTGRLNEGEISIDLDGQELVLKPTLRCMTTINRNFNGLANARAALVAENFDAAVMVIRYGSGMSDSDARKLPDRLYKHGMKGDLLSDLITFVATLGNGGKNPLAESGDDENQSEDKSGSFGGGESAGN